MVCRTAQPYARGAEQAIARIRSTLESRYFIVFTVDTTLGVLIAYVLHQQALKFARRKQASSECVAGHIICACIECRPSPSPSPSPQWHGAVLTPFGVCSKWPERRCVQFPRESRQMRSIWQSASGTHASTSLAVRVCAWVLQQSNPHLARLRFACVPLRTHRFLPVAFKARHLPHVNYVRAHVHSQARAAACVQQCSQICETAQVTLMQRCSARLQISQYWPQMLEYCV